MADTKKLVSLSRVNATGGLDYFYPKTVATQVFVDETQGTTVAGHVADTNIHLSAAERTALNATNTANGYVKLGADGYVPSSLLNPSVLAITTEFADIDAMLADTTVTPGQIVMVIDASDDTTVTSGWAIYRKRVGTGIDYTQLAGWQKIAEAESLDVTVSWDNIQNKPTSTVAEIDQAVADDHTHANKAVLDLITDTGTAQAPVLQYNGNTIAFDANVTKFYVTTTASAPTGAREGDFVIVDTTPVEP
jgi:hypothetical protein